MGYGMFLLVPPLSYWRYIVTGSGSEGFAGEFPELWLGWHVIIWLDHDIANGFSASLLEDVDTTIAS